MGRAALMRSLMTSQCRRQPAMGVQLPMVTTHALLQKPCPRQAGSQACSVCPRHSLLFWQPAASHGLPAVQQQVWQAQVLQGRCVGTWAA